MATGAGTLALTPPQVAVLLGAAAVALRVELDALPEEMLRYHPAPGEWCAKAVLGHLIEAERRGFAGRIRIILAAEAPALETWDPDEVARQRADCDRGLGELLEEFLALRNASAALVRGLGPDDLERLGHHPKVGELRVRELLHEWIHHDRNHLKQIQTAVQGFVWPHLGNAQRFSAP
jgi:hypothetical protein